MGTANRYDRILNNELKCRAVWFPVTSAVGVGDSGEISGGLFVKRGNVADFGATPKTEKGPGTSLNFKSARSSTVALDADGKTLPQLPAGSVDATLQVKFEKSNSFLLKAGKITLEQIADVAEVSHSLVGATTASGMKWNHRWRVVWQVYTGHDVMFVSTKDADTTIEFSGKADALKAVQGGSFSSDVNVHFTSNVALDIVGGTGPIGLNLFRVRGSGEADTKSLTDTAGGVDHDDDHDSDLADTV